ncbi:hypothetical protein LJC58_10180, partial [Lachnospiraceae bacterium OttesenSCG-928-D06]|nr:hypothetical protein [Lachnospiraceae bacterium OttesenSCG-928-D06]
MMNIVMSERELSKYNRKLKRQREVQRQKMILLIIALSFIIILMVSVRTMVVSANTGVEEIALIAMLLSQIVPSIQSIVYNFDEYIN